MKTALSVITPVYQGAAHILSCLENVSQQIVEGVEHLVVDGGSSDGTGAIVAGFAREHPWVRLYSERDRGQSDAMNKGLRLAQGNVVGFLNADDAYAPGALRRALECFQGSSEPALHVGNCHMLDQDGKVVYINRPRRLRLFDLLVGPPLNDFPINPSAYFYHKSLHAMVGGYDVNDHYTMDLDFLLRALRVGRGHYHDEHWGIFRFLPGSKTFEAMRTGQNRTRVREVRRRYMRNLTWTQRLLLPCMSLGVLAKLYYFCYEKAQRHHLYV